MEFYWEQTHQSALALWSDCICLQEHLIQHHNWIPTAESDLRGIQGNWFTKEDQATVMKKCFSSTLVFSLFLILF